jgi:hypothetical protein
MGAPKNVNISSKQILTDVNAFAAVVRVHGSIENRLHLGS